jgi:NADP-dependent 3-hydroxy acid dehydrogenase YdfG
MEATGLRVLVTGASSGIGLAVAGAFRTRAAWVGLVARDPGRLSDAVSKVGGAALSRDVTSADQVELLRQDVAGVIGGAPDVIVNSAGSFLLAPFTETSPEDFDRQVDVNLRGPFLVTRAFLPAMLARGSGHVVNVSSIAGRLAFPGNAAYSASKFGLRGMHEVLAAELRGTGVRATLIEPAATDTPLWDALQPDDRPDLPSRTSMLNVEDVARAIVYAVEQPAGIEVSLLALQSSR